MDFIENNDEINHYKVIANALAVYSEVYFATAFLKLSGLDLLENDIRRFLGKGGKLKVIAGQNFALTEPQALKRLRDLTAENSESNIFLAKAKDRNDIFHPKLYLFKTGDKCCIISGSANITKGGLIGNKEASVLVKCSKSDTVWQDAMNCFTELTSYEQADEASLLIIKQYESYYEEQKLHNREAKAIPNRTKTQLAFNYENLKKHFERFDTKQRKAALTEKMKDYEQALNVLNEIADKRNLTTRNFIPLLDSLVGSKSVGRLWHSGSLFRLRNKVHNYPAEFQRLVRYIRENKKKSAEKVFEGAKSLVQPIEGAAANYVAEIMVTYNYIDYANINRNPITVLRSEAGVNMKAHSSSFNGKDYEEYCELIKEISKKLGLSNMLEADSFFNEIYWQLER